MPGAPSSVLVTIVVWPGAPSSVLSKAMLEEFEDAITIFDEFVMLTQNRPVVGGNLELDVQWQ